MILGNEAFLRNLQKAKFDMENHSAVYFPLKGKIDLVLFFVINFWRVRLGEFCENKFDIHKIKKKKIVQQLMISCCSNNSRKTKHIVLWLIEALDLFIH